jgi:hypothetical protein
VAADDIAAAAVATGSGAAGVAAAAELSNPDAEHVSEIKARFDTTLHVCDAELQVVLVSTASQCMLIS